MSIKFNHVHRKANKLADFLANQGVSYKESRVFIGWQEMPHGNLKTLIHNLVEEDKEVFPNKT